MPQLFTSRKAGLSARIISGTLLGLVVIFVLIAGGVWIGTTAIQTASQATIRAAFQDHARLTEESFLDILKNKGKSLTEFASQIAASKIISFDYESLRNYLKEIMRDGDVVYAIYQIDFDGTIIAEHIPIEHTPWADTPHDSRPEGIFTLTSRMVEDGYAIEHIRSIDYNGEKIGRIIIGISQQTLLNFRQNELKNVNAVSASLQELTGSHFSKFSLFLLLVYFGAFLLIGLLLYAITRILIISKLERMSAVFAEVAEGDLTKRIDIKADDEIGDLCRAFNSMTASLAKVTVSKDNLEEKNRALLDTQAELRMSNKEIAASHEFTRSLIENSPSGIILVNRSGQVISINAAGAAILGCDKSNIVGRPATNFFPADPSPQATANPGPPSSLPIEETCRCVGGREREILSSSITITDHLGETFIVKTFVDITERQRLEQEVADERAFLQRIIDAVVDPIMVIATDHRVLLMNQVVRKNVGKELARIENPFCHLLSHQSNQPCNGENHRCPLEEVQRTNSPATMVHEHLVEGKPRFMELRASPLFDRDGKLTGIIEASRDITDRVMAERRLQDMSITDELTGLLNRRGFVTMAERQLKVAERTGQSLFLLYADLDNMKWINDTLGHKIGDEALIETAEIMRKTFRQADILGRLGGDEFAVLQTSSSGAEDDEDTLIRRFEEQITVANGKRQRPFQIAISIGVVRFNPAVSCSLEELMNSADERMYECKRKRKEGRTVDAG